MKTISADQYAAEIALAIRNHPQSEDSAWGILCGVAVYLAGQHGPHAAAEKFYRIADELACQPDTEKQA